MRRTHDSVLSYNVFRGMRRGVDRQVAPCFWNTRTIFSFASSCSISGMDDDVFLPTFISYVMSSTRVTSCHTNIKIQ
jgi:hypothetical protein